MKRPCLGLVFAVALLCGCAKPSVSLVGGQVEPGERPLQDFRVVGRAVDVQGLVQVRSVNELRWRPLENRQLLEPGDWVRCDNRGPNAVRIALAGGGNIILGPGSVVECAESATFSVTGGELEMTPGERLPVTVLAASRKQSFKQATRLRVKDDELTVLEHEPSWLQGFKGTMVNESMGSLLVQVDGRDVPLTVGYHKVTIDIRDQIARTVIEESFVNHTNSRLEGIFHFPLPADASISEFGMWIGDELVTADVVEKQRAREIYETILRENRDPGLLEWAGGNMFKARVFPIFAHSEKRVTITYTQVLPMRDGVYRYTYPLQSDMLRQNPLRELHVAATISSAAPLKAVECTSHHARQRLTAHAASLEFTAQEYTPTRDFEIAITPKLGDSPITIVPHERGEDGYFLMLVNGRGAEHGARSAEQGAGGTEQGAGGGEQGAWSTKHEAPSTKHDAPSTSPLTLVFLADTSGSMDQRQRENQAEFLRAMLSSLGQEDRFALYACDVDCVALSDGLAAPDAAESALDKLARRESLGWTDLDKAFAAVLGAAPAGTQVIYIGDGIPATSQIDPVEAARRLKNLVRRAGNQERRTKNEEPATLHAVATGSAYEAGVMKAIASMGGGSFREMRGERGPITAAAELLHELTHPGLRDLSVEFRGIRTACVYPEELPNLAAGMQQIITGRYLPASATGNGGEVVVRGKLGDQPVEFTAKIVFPQLPKPSTKNQPPSTTNQEPGTKNEEQAASSGNSFIPRLWARRHLDVLLAQGATPEIRARIVGFSQEFKIMTPYTSFLVLESDEDRERFGVKRHFEMRDGEAFFAQGKDRAKYELARQQMLAAAKWRLDLRRRRVLALGDLGRVYPAVPQPTMMGRAMYYRSRGEEERRGSQPGENADYSIGGAWKAEGADGGFLGMDAPGDRSDLDAQEKFLDNLDGLMVDTREFLAPEPILAESAARERSVDRDLSPQPRTSNMLVPSLRLDGKKKERVSLPGMGGRPDANFALSASSPAAHQLFSPDQINDYWLKQIFPNLPSSLPGQIGDLPEAWPQEARELLTGLLRQQRLSQEDTALRFTIKTEHIPADAEQAATHSELLCLWDRQRWLQRTTDMSDNVQTAWLKDRRLGQFDHTYLTARVREAQDGDSLVGFPDFGDGGRQFPAGSNPATTVTMRKDGESVVLAFRYAQQDFDGLRLVIDPGRQVVLDKQTFDAQGLTAREEFTDFVRIAGIWWPGKVVFTDGSGRVTRRQSVIVETLAEEALDAAFADLAKFRLQAVELPQPLPLPTLARRRIAAGKGDVADQVSVVCHAVALQKWDDVRKHEKSLFQAIANAASRPWMEMSLFVHSRRKEEVRLLIEQMAGQLAESAKVGAVPASRSRLKPARQLVNFANSAMQVDERLVLLDSLKQVYQLGEVFEEWRINRISLLRQAGQVDTALADARDFHREAPDHESGINLLASLLVGAGETAEAYALLDEKTGTDSPLAAQAQINLCTHWLSLLHDNRSERADQKAVLERLFSLIEPLGQASESTYRRYLSVLMNMDPEGLFKERMNQWLALVGDQDDLKARQLEFAKLYAAVQMALGNSWDGSLNYLPPEWLPDLVRIVETCSSKAPCAQIVNSIMSDRRFIPTEAAAALRAKFAIELEGDLGTLDISQIMHRTQWIRSAPPAVEKVQWQGILANLEPRWQALVGPEAELAGKYSLGEMIAELTQAHLGLDAAIAFSRRRLALAVDFQKAVLQQKHFNLLTSGRWRKDYEGEAFALLDDLCRGDDPMAATTSGIRALMLLVDWMVDGRVEAGLQEEELAGQLQNMDRQTRWQLEKQLEADASLAALKRLESGRDALPDVLLPWAGIESLDLQTRLLNAKTVPEGGMNEGAAGDVVAELREGLGPQAPQRFADANELLLFRRRLALAQFWSVGGQGLDKASRESLGQYLIDYCESALKLAPREPEAGEQGLTLGQDSWRSCLYDLLIILDQPRPLEKHLQEWVEIEGGDHWRLPLAYLLAATDRIGGAIVEMERAEAAELLGPADYRALSGWYQVVDERSRHIAARRKALEQMPEHVLINWIYQQRNQSRRQDWKPAKGVPPELDIDTIVDHFIVLFRKSQSPSSNVWQLRDIYKNSRDFRLLRCVPEGMVGMSAQQVYPMLGNLRQVLDEIRDEAVVDELLAAIQEIRQASQSTVDARALLLLEADVLRRAAEVINQPGQHAPKALAALQAAFDKGDWGPGEKLLMADYLASMGQISQEPLAAEQRRQLKILHEAAASGTLESLQICSSRARTLSHYSQWDEAINLLAAELTAFRQANGGTFAANMNVTMDQMVYYCEDRQQFKKAEGLLLAELERPANRNQWRWLRQRLYRTYSGAIRRLGTTSLGSGDEQYQDACKQLAAEWLSEPDYNHGTQLATIQCEIFRSAREAKIETVAADVVRFAMDYFPEMAMPGQQYIHQYHGTVGTVAETVKDLASPKAGIAFLLAVAAKETPLSSHDHQSFWGQHAKRLAEWRQAAKDLGELEKPLLDLVCRELRRHLATGQSYRQDMYHKHHSYFWAEQAAVFAAVAEEMLAKHPDSGQVAFQVAKYFYEGLGNHGRAIDILAAAYERGRLDENAQSYFAQCLERQSRWPEAVPVLEHLVAWRPDTLGYRTRLMIAYFGANRPVDVERCRAAADQHFRRPQLWNENVAYSLGSACRHCRLDAQAVVYLEDAIALRRKARNDKIQNDAQISNYYYELAEAYSNLGNTQAAVDAASGAIVCWSRNHEQRRRAVSRLTAVLNQAKDLDGYMQEMDAEAARTGLENPILRKAAGLAYDNKAQPDQAIAQYARALASQPNDADTHRLHVDLLSRLGRKEVLPGALLAWHRAAPRDLAVIQKLQQAYKDLGLQEQAERACTMLVESQPLEAAGHQALAELRQNQERWEEAIPHWLRVAELRELEPTGLLGLAKAQIHLNQTEAAKQTVDRLLAKTWPEGFGNVHDQARNLLR